MTDVLGAAIYTRLVGDAALVALLDVYRGVPAIFTDPDVPPDAILSKGWIQAGTVPAGIPFDTKTSLGQDTIRDLGCYVPVRDSNSAWAIATRARDRLHRHKLAVEGFGSIIVNVTLPVTAPTDDTVYGLLMSLRWVGMVCQD